GAVRPHGLPLNKSDGGDFGARYRSSRTVRHRSERGPGLRQEPDGLNWHSIGCHRERKRLLRLEQMMCEPQAKAPDGDLQTVTALLVGGRCRSLACAIEDCHNST